MKSLSAGVKVGVLVILVLAAGYIVWSNLSSDPAGEENYGLRARFRDASGLPSGSKVVVAGIPVGEITGTAIEGRRAVVTFKVRKDIVAFDSGVVYKKATSLLGNYYLELDPGAVQTTTPDGVVKTHIQLKPGDFVPTVVEATSPDQLLRRIEASLPNIDEMITSVRDLSEDLRRLVNGPLASTLNKADATVAKIAPDIEVLVREARSAISRFDQITKDVRGVTGDGGKKLEEVIDKLNRIPDQIEDLIATTKGEIQQTGGKLREKLDKIDEKIIDHTGSIAQKIDEGEGTIGQLVNDDAIGDNVSDIAEDANSFLGSIFNLQTYVGLRSEYNMFAGLARHYISVELHTRPDKYYLIEVEKGPRGDYPDVTLTFDPTVDPNNWIRKSVIEDKFRFTFQFAKRFGWFTLRYGLKESTGGIGGDAELKWWNRRVNASIDIFDATFDQLPRVKLTAAVEVFRNLYVLGGVDELINPPDTLTIITGADDVPIQFEEFRFGRDYFLGAMLRFNDEDLAALLAIGGSAIGGVAGN